VPPGRITFEHIDKWYAKIMRQKGAGEAGRAMKIWRAHYNVMASMRLCRKGEDPSLAIRKKSVPGRTETWTEGEAVRLINGAWRAGYKGLACIVAVAWDTGFAPVDARTLTPGDIRGDQTDWWFFIERGKTGEAAIGTLTPRTRQLVHAYVDSLDIELMDTAPIFRTRGYAPSTKGGRPRANTPYTKDSLIDDFADLRRSIFGKDEKRRLMDMRRSGAVESMAGGASAEAMSTKLANSMDQNRSLWRTYLPVDKATVRSVDEARRIGRQKLRTEQKADKKLKLGKEKS
jgi:integrase